MIDLSQIPTGVEIAALGSGIFVFIRFIFTRLSINPALEERALANLLSFLILLLINRLRAKNAVKNHPPTVMLLDSLHGDIIKLKTKFKQKKVIG
jgi:hypothetical protein